MQKSDWWPTHDPSVDSKVVLWTEVCLPTAPPPNLYVEVLNPSTLECDRFGNWDLKEVVKLKWGL